MTAAMSARRHRLGRAGRRAADGAGPAFAARHLAVVVRLALSLCSSSNRCPAGEPIEDRRHLFIARVWFFVRQTALYLGNLLPRQHLSKLFPPQHDIGLTLL